VYGLVGTCWTNVGFWVGIMLMILMLALVCGDQLCRLSCNYDGVV
jgi:hypothetical protein